MIISQENKVAYIGMPHTGSSFIHHHCKNAGSLMVEDNIYKHATVSQCLELGAEEDYEFFIFVRNPVCWMKSKWGFMKRVTASQSYIDRQTCQEWKNQCVLFEQTNPTIDDHILDLLSGGDISFSYYVDHPCNITYLKYERFKESCETLFKRLNVPLPDLSEKINSNEGIDLTIKRETEEKIKLYFRNEIKKFGYLENK
jgi:hypothetical protein